MLQSYINEKGQFPPYSIALHLSDLNPKFAKSNDIQLVSREVVYYDVTQFVLGGPITGIQRVVNAFLQQDVCPVVFYNNNYYKFVDNKIAPKFIYSPLTKLLNFIGKHTYMFFSSLNFTLLQKIKNLRLKMVLKNINVDYRIPLQLSEIEEANIFISDLPSSREHLEFLLVLSYFTRSSIGIFLHDLIPITHPELMPKNSTAEFNLYAKLLLNIEKVFVSTQSVLSTYENYRKMFKTFNTDQKTFITSFPDFRKSLIKNDSPIKFSEKENEILNSDKPFLLAVGTVFTRKNYSLVLRALQKLNEVNITCNFVIAAHKSWGDSALEFAFKQFTDSKKYTFILYGLSDTKLEKFYEKASIVVFPSLAEGFGLPILEARNYGKIVLANEIEPMLSFSKVDSGIITLPPHSSAWAEKIKQILQKDVPINSPVVSDDNELKIPTVSSWCSSIIEKIQDR